MPTDPFVSIAEAAYITELADQDLNRLIDERIVPDALVLADDGRRRFSRLACALAQFYLATDNDFTASLRRSVIAEMAARVQREDASSELLALGPAATGFDWLVQLPFGEIDVSSFVRTCSARARAIDDCKASITRSNDVMDGIPVFAGTRLPIDTILASTERGIAMERILESFPFLTYEMVDVARVYDATQPKRAPRRGLGEVHPDWILLDSRVVRPARASGD